MGADDLGRSRPPRQTAAKILHEIFERNAYTAISIDRELRRRTDFDQTQRNLITELVNGTVRMSKHLDWVLNLFLKKPIDQQNAWLRVALRLGAYQLLFMDRIPAKIAVDSAVGMVKERLGPSLAGVCNGVLRELERNRGDLPWDRDENERQSLTAIYYSQPEWIVQILSEEILAACHVPHSREEILVELASKHEIAMDASHFLLNQASVNAHLTWLSEKGDIEHFMEGYRLLWRQKVKQEN